MKSKNIDPINILVRSISVGKKSSHQKIEMKLDNINELSQFI